MAIDFPASPTTGQVFGVWRWDGAKWVQSSQAPVVQSFNARTGAVMFQQSDAAGVGIYNDVGRNLLHNGTFVVAQRGAGPFTTTATNTLDRWIMIFTLDTFSVSSTQLSDADRSAIGDEAARSSLGSTVTGNAGATALSLISQRIEDVRRLAGKTVTLSFWARSSAVGLKIGACIEQAFGAGGSPSPYVPGVGQAVTISTSWARYSLTFAVPTIVGKTLGTDGSDYTGLMLWFSCGATNATRAGNIGVQSGTFFLYGAQLEISSTATPLAKREYAEELRLAQRYYQVGHARQSIGSNSWQASWSNQHVMLLPTQMRAQPTCATSGIAQTNCSGTTVAGFGNYAVMHSFTITAATGGVSSAVDFTASADL